MLFFLQNIDDVLNRGFVLSELEKKSEDLKEGARKYRFDYIFQIHKVKWRIRRKNRFTATFSGKMPRV